MVTAPRKTHNEDLTRDEQADLLALHLRNIRLARAEQEKTALADKQAKAKIAGHYKLVDKDLGFTRLKIEDLLEKQDMSDDALALYFEEQADLYDLGGVAVGEQLSLKLPDTADDAKNAYNAGSAAFDQLKDRTDIPSRIATMFHTNYLAGYDARADQINAMIARAEAAKKLREARPKPGQMAADPEQTDLEDAVDGDLTEEQLKAKADVLVARGFTEPSTAETDEPKVH